MNSTSLSGPGALQTLLTIDVDGSTMDVHVFARSRPHEASGLVVLMYPRSGMDGFPQRVAHQLCEHDYAVFVPDITHRISADIPFRDRKRLLTDQGIMDDIGVLLAQIDASGLRDRPRFIMGHCMGGRNALLGASRYPFAGALCFYGGEMFEGWGCDEAPFSRLHRIRCPVLGFFGANDKNPSPGDVARIDEELTRAGIPHRFKTYPDVGHAFQQNADRSPQERRAADDSTAQALAFMAELTATYEADTHATSSYLEAR